MKNERSIPFSQSWCSLVATDVCRNPAPKKRFLDEYESSLCYRKSAKEIIQKGLFLDIVNVQAQKRVEAVKVAAVVYFLMFGNQTPAYTKLLSLFGREYARMTDAVSAVYKDKLGRNCLSKYFTTSSDQDGQGEMAIFIIYLLASPESKLLQNQARYELLFTTFKKDANAETAATEQDTILQKYGVPLQRNLFDYTREALIATKKTDISVKGINGDVNARNWFDYESYGFSCRYDTLLSMALHDAGVSEQPALERTITKQKFTDAQKAAAKSVYFTKLDEEHHNIDGGDFFAMIDDETIEMNEDGTIVAEEGAAVPTLALINLYNMLLPMYLAVRNLGEAYSEEVKATLSNELFGNGDRNSNEEALVKRIEQLEKQLAGAKENEERAVNAANAAEQKLAQSKKRENALSVKLEAAYDEIDELMARIPEEPDREGENEQEIEKISEPTSETEAVDYAAVLDKLMMEHSVVIVGGNQNLMKKFQVAHPNASLVDKDMIAACDQQVRNADAVMFKVDSMSHALYGKCKAICHKYDIPFCYLPNVASIQRMEQSMCEQLTDILG